MDEALEDLLDHERKKLFNKTVQRLVKKLPANQDEALMRFPEPKTELDSLYQLEPLDLPVKMQVQRDTATGEIVGFTETTRDAALGAAHSSLSMQRAPAAAQQGLMGAPTNMPFLPGGMEDEMERLQSLLEENRICTEEFDFENDLLSVPPGFETGMEFEKPNKTKEIEQNEQEEETDDFMNLMQMMGDNNDEDLRLESDSDSEVEENIDSDEEENLPQPIVIDFDAVKGDKVTVPHAPAAPMFAETLDSSRPVDLYRQMMPRLARKWPFDLDPFQQQAVLCLERGDSVFVSAHTSAGKTVVAEYAIALCRTHLTRAIYTSPIKALSNQKFREFKLIFEDVGLITGDIQLQPDAFCLIMTTEILRSMLYNGSEVVRELEWVIFDEVHYINDSERGVVWEEVLIMLPSHVKIIMLSATAPNSVEFADWVGRIKNRKIYVISTSKRPVPLEHFLYTGSDGKTKDNRFLIVLKDGTFNTRGYTQAMDSNKVVKKTPAARGKGGGKPHYGNRNDKNIYITLLDHLKRCELLPAVIFTFSRKRCDQNAAMLTTVDLSTKMEKKEVHEFFSKCILRLKGTDRKLPQVLQMYDLCQRGVAVHHSGILPILKEVVEMLFQQGFVKVLFATETFAMGVNMPARTVVFDSIQKFDGTQKRDLLAGEYIQMAGRAGRRGLDTTGTVIALCKGPNGVPESSDLNRVMLGRATKLESHFRVTYSMLLNLLRVQQLNLRVEQMLKRSYVEISSLKHETAKKEKLSDVSARLKQVVYPNCAVCNEGGLVDLHDHCRQYLALRRQLWLWFLSLPSVAKSLVPGRVLVVCRTSESPICNAPAVLLRSETNDNGQKVFTVLYLSSQNAQKSDSVDETNWQMESHDFLGLAQKGTDSVGLSATAETSLIGRVLTDLTAHEIVGVTNKTINIASSEIQNDWDRRQMPRFRRASPDRVFVSAVNALETLSEQWKGSGSVPFLQPDKDFQCTLDLLDPVQQLKNMAVQLKSFTCTRCLCFEEHFMHIRGIVKLQEEEKLLNYQLSVDSLRLKPEYDSKLQVLQIMGFVDANNLIELKGKVACEIHQHELLITELMLENKFQNLSAPEIAAVLSSTTCQHKSNDSELKMPPKLELLRNEIEDVARRICNTQQECGVKQQEDNILELLRFDLMEVVYEWARGVPFAQLMQLTDAQEGIIVRCIQRLAEVCRDVRNAARIVGDPSLEQKMNDTSTAIKRDIVFAASLYTVG